MKHLGKALISHLIKLKLDLQFPRSIDRYKGVFITRKLTCNEHILVLNFTQLAGKESLHDYESYLTTF
ncbi:MAG TPA: hypothetical protein DIC44_10530 [Rikenellaceae bacterium]|nr:hypothetical protein [Rikenellaceae bacterium]